MTEVRFVSRPSFGDMQRFTFEPPGAAIAIALPFGFGAFRVG